MKNVIFALAILTAPLTVAADESTDSVCDTVAELSGSFFDARQSGVSLAEALRIAGGNAFVRRMVIDLYESPRYTSPSIVADARMRYVTKWHLVCIRAREE